MSEENLNASGLAVSGAILGGLSGGVPGFIVGGIIGQLINEAIKCPRCGNFMQIFNGFWRCRSCGYIKN